MGIVARQSIFNSIASYLGVIIGAVNTLLLFPHIFTADQFGLTRVLGAAATLFCSFSMLGTPGITLKFFPFFRNEENKHNGFLFFILLVPFVGYILFLGIAFLFKADIIDFYSSKSNLFEDYYQYIPLLIIYLIYFNVFDSYLRGLFKSVIHAFLVNVVLRLMWSVFILLYFFKVIDFDQFIFCYVNAYALLILVEVIYTISIKQFFILPNFKKFDKAIVKKISVFALFIILGSSSGMLANTIDSLMIGGLIEDGLAQVAFYAVAMYMGIVIAIPYQSIVRIANPVISAAWKKNDLTEIDNIYKQSSLNLLIIGSLLFLGIWLNADNIFHMLPEEYAQAKYVLLFICLAKLYDVCTGVNSSIIQFSDFFRLMLYFNGLLIILLIVTNYLLIPVMGIEGAALATFISIFTVNTIRMVIIKVKMNIVPFTLKSLIVPVIGGLTYIVVYFIPAFENFILDAIVRSIIISILFITPIYLLNVSDEFSKLINKVLRTFRLKK